MGYFRIQILILATVLCTIDGQFGARPGLSSIHGINSFRSNILHPPWHPTPIQRSFQQTPAAPKFSRWNAQGSIPFPPNRFGPVAHPAPWIPNPRSRFEQLGPVFAPNSGKPGPATWRSGGNRTPLAPGYGMNRPPPAFGPGSYRTPPAPGTGGYRPPPVPGPGENRTPPGLGSRFSTNKVTNNNNNNNKPSRRPVSSIPNGIDSSIKLKPVANGGRFSTAKPVSDNIGPKGQTLPNHNSIGANIDKKHSKQKPNVRKLQTTAKNEAPIENNKVGTKKTKKPKMDKSSTTWYINDSPDTAVKERPIVTKISDITPGNVKSATTKKDNKIIASLSDKGITKTENKQEKKTKNTDLENKQLTKATKPEIKEKKIIDTKDKKSETKFGNKSGSETGPLSKSNNRKAKGEKTKESKNSSKSKKNKATGRSTERPTQNGEADKHGGGACPSSIKVKSSGVSCFGDFSCGGSGKCCKNFIGGKSCTKLSITPPLFEPKNYV